MKKTGWTGWMLLAVLAMALLMPAPAGAFEVKFRLYGGYGYLLGGDLNSGTEGLGKMWLDLLDLLGASRTGSFEAAHYGLQYGGDLVFMLSPNIGLGLGAESIGMSKSSTAISGLVGNPISVGFQAEASAIPLKASLFFCAPFGPGARMSLHLGVGYYLAKMSNQVRIEQMEGPEFIEYSASAESQALGFHGGLGFEFDLARNISLFIEAQGRYAKLGGFEGENVYASNSGTSREKGALYYFESQGFTSEFYSIIGCSDSAPAENSSTKNVREAKIDLSGGTALGGIIFRF